MPVFFLLLYEAGIALRRLQIHTDPGIGVGIDRYIEVIGAGRCDGLPGHFSAMHIYHGIGYTGAGYVHRQGV